MRPPAAPWLSHVMVSRQETARPLLTPGEVMQGCRRRMNWCWSPAWRRSGAKKLRYYYEDRNFTARVLPAPALSEVSYADRPAPRSDDWGGQVRGPHLELAVEGASASDEDEGGLQQQRHPGIGEEAVVRPADVDASDPLGLGDDESDTAADKRAMDRVRPLSAVRVLMPSMRATPETISCRGSDDGKGPRESPAPAVPCPRT